MGALSKEKNYALQHFGCISYIVPRMKVETSGKEKEFLKDEHFADRSKRSSGGTGSTPFGWLFRGREQDYVVG